ncbi:Calpain-like cysteine protease C2 [Phytophthora cinnamomi]|uniref:Calpain-like cysteine protease C2 n=1 Tax=Phytophthora cinnamomi TaxID=4785 RepID=UPI00355AB24B|nr:Calpain-like cysteine protease C2 [Phytophthora cinnamomi]
MKKSSRSSLPAIVTLNSTFSGYISIPAADTGSIVYRMYPQKTLRYGYSMQVESDHKVVFQDAPTYWRSLRNLRAMECDGTYPVMLPGSWNIIFKHSFDLSPLTSDNGERSSSVPELRIDLHLTEELLASFTHISIVNDATGEVKKTSTLCSTISLPASSNDGVYSRTAYTLIVDCAPGNFHVRQGKWKLALASDWDITKSTTHQMKLTRFEGVYEPNKPLLCFRDVIMAPKTSIWTSFQLQLLQDGAVVNTLSAKLQVFDLGAEQNPQIGEVSAKGEVRLLQLPCIPAGDISQPPADDKRGYILQGSIDRSTCIVPDVLQSLRPFRSNAGLTPPKEVITAPVDENEPSEDAPPSGESNTCVPATARSSRGLSGIKWRVNCWSTEEVKLLEDNTKELQYEAIRASWAEKAVDRNTNGAVSRSLYLGKLDEAEAKMKLDNMIDEQIAKVRGRFEWVQAVKSKVAGKSKVPEGVGESYLQEVGTGDEKLLTEDELAESKRLLLERIGAVEADREQRRVARALAKEERAKELKDMVRSVIEKRGASLKRQQELKRELAAVQTRSA